MKRNVSEKGEIKSIRDKNVFEDGWECIRERIVMCPRRDFKFVHYI